MFIVPKNFPPPLWDSAEVLKPGKETRQLAFKFAQKYITLLKDKKVSDVVMASELLYRTTAKFTDKTTEEYISRNREIWQQMFDQNLFKPLPLNDKDFMIEIVGGGKIIRLLRKDGSDAVKSTSKDGFENSVPLMIGKIKGKFRILL